MESEPEFTFQPDAVHPNTDGHWFMARQLIRWFSDERATDADSPQNMLTSGEIPEAVLPLVRQRLDLRRNAYLSAAGHKRPGIRPGETVESAERKAQFLTTKIEDLSAER